ncbi:MAG: hypothetical protein M3177_04780 [Pseudomonadota bacterium]|nr:hypothetical protein [Pseudomonadota bacterium]
MAALAALWLEEIRSGRPPADDDVRMTIVLMNFTAPADVQWDFLVMLARLEQQPGELRHPLGESGHARAASFSASARAPALTSAQVTPKCSCPP